jgi:hypothetical protein
VGVEENTPTSASPGSVASNRTVWGSTQHIVSYDACWDANRLTIIVCSQHSLQTYAQEDEDEALVEKLPDDITPDTVSPQWGWYVSITPPQDMYHKASAVDKT